MQARMHVTKRFGGRLNLRRMRRSGPSASGKGHDQHRIEVVEGLDLHDAPAGEVLLMCLPLAIPGGDGVPTRVVLAFDEQPEGEGTRDEL